jgi:hypothetical protein
MALSLKKPSRESAKAAANKIAGGKKRIVVDVPEALHRKVKERCFERRIEIRDYVLGLLAKDGLK